jgi:tight adherence protein C
MFETIVALLAFSSVSLLVAIFFPKAILARPEDDEEIDGTGFIYQITPLLAEMAKCNAKISWQSYKQNLSRKMTAAGDPFGIKLTPDEVIALAELAGVAGAIVLSIFFGVTPAAVILGFLFGFALPLFWLTDSMKKRQLTIRRQLPDFLDLLTLSVEAGLDFNAALNKLVKITRRSPLLEEFKLMTQEMKLGTTRYNALKAMAARVNIPDFSAFVASLQQTDKLGASLGPTLRIQSDQMRKRRMQLAEKAGGEASVKLLVPLMLFIFPAVFIMLFGPLIIQFFMSN